jgi:hypothetical protein
MANLCPSPIHLCRIRLTRLTSTGAIAAAPSNHYVSDKPMMLTIDPSLQEGEEKNLIGGCDCVQASYRGPDKLLRYNLTLQMAALEPGLYEMLTGATILTNASTELIGASFPIQVSCSNPTQPPSALEAWQDLWVGDAQNANPRYVRWIFPMTFWQMDTTTLENEFLQVQFKGYTRQNAWANPYIDFPTGVASIGTQGAFFWDNVIPAAYCGYSTTST